MPAVAIIGLVVAAAGSLYAGYEAQQQAKEGRSEARKQAGNATANAADDAAVIRERGRRLLSTQRAALGASGGKIDDGSASTVLMDTKQLTERDALLRIKQGEQEAEYFRGLAKQFNRKSKSAVIGANLGAGQAVASGMSSVRQATPRQQTVQTDTSPRSSSFSLAQQSAASNQPKYSLLTGDYSMNTKSSYAVN